MSQKSAKEIVQEQYIDATIEALSPNSYAVWSESWGGVHLGHGNSIESAWLSAAKSITAKNDNDGIQEG